MKDGRRDNLRPPEAKNNLIILGPFPLACLRLVRSLGAQTTRDGIDRPRHDQLAKKSTGRIFMRDGDDCPSARAMAGGGRGHSSDD